MSDAPSRCVSDVCLWCYCHMDLRGLLPEDIAVNFGMRKCALSYMRDHGHMKLEKE